MKAAAEGAGVEAPSIHLVLGTDSLQMPLTGIGRYTFELARGLLQSPQIASVVGYDLGKLQDVRQRLAELTAGSGQAARPGALRRYASRSVVATTLYRYYVDALSGSLLSKQAGAVFHSPNFHLPRHPGPRVVTVHDLSFRLMPECHPRARVRWMNKMVPQAVAAADHVICVSAATRRDLEAEYPVAPGKVSVIPLGVDADYRPRSAAETAAVLEPLGLAHGRYFLCVATLEPRKNLDVLVQAYLSLPAALRRQAPLVLAGGYGWGCESLRDRLAGLAESEGVRHLGYVADADLVHLYSGAGCFVFPSRFEGFGLPVLEAQASAVPVITSDVSSLPEVASEHCQLVAPGDAAALAAAMLRSLEDPDWRDRCRRSGLENAAAYTWQRCVDETIAVYRRVAGLPGASG